jgi:hypothetical protein
VDPEVALRSVMRSLSYRIEQPSIATPAAVFDTLIDVERWPNWVPSLVEASWERRGAPDTGVGGIRRTRSRVLGASLTLREEILGGTRPHYHSYNLLSHALGFDSYQAAVQIEERANDCLIIWTATFSTRIPGWGRPLQLIARSQIKRLAAALAREAQQIAR